MKKFYTIIIVLLTLSCSDGDLTIETLDFDSVSIQNCGTLTTTTEVLFKIDGDEALILDLQTGLLQNEISTTPIQSSISNQSRLIYRVFSDNVNTSYFCDDFPPSEPKVTEEIEAESGTVVITTTSEDNITFTHTIQLQDIILRNSSGESIIDLSINDFGPIETSN